MNAIIAHVKVDLIGEDSENSEDSSKQRASGPPPGGGRVLYLFLSFGYPTKIGRKAGLSISVPLHGGTEYYRVVQYLDSSFTAKCLKWLHRRWVISLLLALERKGGPVGREKLLIMVINGINGGNGT